jgi:hypothetical protein
MCSDTSRVQKETGNDEYFAVSDEFIIKALANNI